MLRRRLLNYAAALLFPARLISGKKGCELHSELASGNQYFRIMPLPKAGDLIERHGHKFDHNTAIVRGSVSVVRWLPDGTVLPAVIFQAPCFFLVKAEIDHEIRALEDHTLAWCMYAHRNPQGEVVQEYTGWENAYADRNY